MDYIKEYFSKDIDKINFIELKDYSDLNIEVENIPLPIMADALAAGIKTGEMADQVDAETILDGMISTIAIDEDFKHGEDYIKILRNFNENIDDYIFFKGIKYLDRNMEKRANIYFRALNIINPSHILGKFNYGLALERIAQENFNEEKVKIGQAFLKESTLEFERVLDLDEAYAIAYYKLGYHYKFNGQYLKAKLMWEKYLNLDSDDLRKQEIREEIDLIEDNVKFESGLTYLSYNKYNEALDSFLAILPRQEQWWELRYLIGNTYAAMNEGEKAIEEYKVALELNNLEEEIYNELGIELFKLGKVEEAVEVFTKGLGKISASYKLYFNRGLGYYQLGDLERSYSDVSRAEELEPADKNVADMKLTIARKLDI